VFTIGKRADQPVRVTIAEAQGDDPAAVVILAPIEPKMRRRAFRAAQRMLEKIGVSPDGVEGDVLLDVSEEVSRELLRLGIIGIEGIADEATGEPFALTPDHETRLRTANEKDRPTGTIDDLLADETVFTKLDAEYVIPDARRRAEKNGLSGSPNGTSTAATPGSDTANSAAKPTRKAAAGGARIKSTRCKATKRKGSGRS
jgi:hypothetical protein